MKTSFQRFFCLNLRMAVTSNQVCQGGCVYISQGLQYIVSIHNENAAEEGDMLLHRFKVREMIEIDETECSGSSLCFK